MVFIINLAVEALIHIVMDHFILNREVVLFWKQTSTHVGWCIRTCPLHRGAPYSECPLSDVQYTCSSGILECLEVYQRVGRLSM